MSSATVKVDKQAFSRATLRSVIQQALADHGIKKVKIDIEPAGIPGKVRVWVISDDFESRSIAERQEIIWDALKDSFDLADRVKITMVLTLTSRDVEGDVAMSDEGPITGKDETQYEVITEEERGHTYTGRSTSQTCQFVVKQIQERQVFALFVSYPEVLLIANNWNDADRWRDARVQVRNLLQSCAWDQIVKTKVKGNLHGWMKVQEDEWLKSISAT